MPEYLAPGVYVEEIERGPRPIEGVPTSTAAFIGDTERGSTEPCLVCSYEEYLHGFGGGRFMPDAVRGFFENGGRRVSDMRSLDPRSTIQDSDHAAFYGPWVRISDAGSGGHKAVPPGGHVLGVYARTDAARGVFKSPANETLQGVLAPDCQVDAATAGELSQRGINLIRELPGRGVRVWGAHTMAFNPSARWRRAAEASGVRHLPHLPAHRRSPVLARHRYSCSSGTNSDIRRSLSRSSQVDSGSWSSRSGSPSASRPTHSRLRPSGWRRAS